MRHKPLARFTAAAILFSVGLISSFAAQTAAKQSGKAAQNTTQSNGVRLPEVHLDGAYFTRDGKRFIPMGAHWNKSLDRKSTRLNSSHMSISYAVFCLKKKKKKIKQMTLIKKKYRKHNI